MNSEEDFFDDDLDDTLQILERDALAATQATSLEDDRRSAAPDVASKPSSRSDVRPAVVNVSRRPPQPSRLNSGTTLGAPPASAPDPPSSDYGLEEGTVIDLDEPSTIIRPGLISRTESGAKSTLQNGKPFRRGNAVLDADTEAAFAAADAELGREYPIRWSRSSHQDTGQDSRVSVLEARILELEADRERQRKVEEELRGVALQKNGEIAVVRSNHSRTIKEYERRIADQQKRHADDMLKHKAELEAGRREREKMETNNRFLQHDLAQQTDIVRRRNDSPRPRLATEHSTPKKLRKVNVGDGFDDDEVAVVSPSKNRDGTRDKSKIVTPRLGNKRKRSAADSPVGSLSFAVSPHKPSRTESHTDNRSSLERRSPAAQRSHDKYAFMQILLGYQSEDSECTVLEELATYHLPSDAETRKSLSSRLLEDMSTISTDAETLALQLQLSVSLGKLWTACLDQTYHGPLYLLFDLLHLSMDDRPAAETATLVDQFCPLCVRSIQLVYYHHVQASIHTKYASRLNREEQKRIARDINVDEVLSVLQTICRAASLRAASNEHFWKSLPTEDVLLMLNKALSIDQLEESLLMLQMSVCTTSFGPISADVTTQSTQEDALVGRLSSLMFEIPTSIEGEPPYSDADIIRLRISILSVFKTLCGVEYGGTLLAKHRHVIGRLIRLINAHMHRLYESAPVFDTNEGESDSQEQDDHALVVQLINLAMRILYHLLHTYDALIDMSEKLAMVRGGYHIFLASMTRLAFSEQLVYERGIEDDVAEAAHLILDNFLSPEEGDAIREAVETPHGSRAAKGTEDALAAATRGLSPPEESLDDGDISMSDI